mmetsp:Transcript_33811/g.82954  ORF Transcript_33811/g.82954 Transcript_33811/m.82954 type:complete len:368 (-) Transcript_33811:96-1199(-)
MVRVAARLEVLVQGEGGAAGAGEGVHDAALLVLAHALLEEVGLALEGDELHPVEGVDGVVLLGHAEGHQQVVCHELDVLLHQVAVHAHQPHGQRVAHELLLDLHRLRHDLPHHALLGLVLQVRVQQAREVAVQALVAADELVGEGEPGHQPALLQPVDAAERAGEEDPLDARERDQALGEGHRAVDPLERPVGLLGDAGDVLHGLEQELLLLGVLDVRVDQQGVHLGVDVLDGDLEPVEGASLGHLDLLHEAHAEVLQHDAVGRREEGEDVADEVLLVVGQLLPVLHVVAQVNLLSGPEGRLGLLVHLPDVVVLDGEHGEAVGVLVQERLRVLAAVAQRHSLVEVGTHGERSGAGVRVCVCCGERVC